MSAVPKLRFPEFDGEWVKCKVGDFCSFLKGKGISKSDIAEDGALRCIRYGELYTHYGVKIDEVASRTNVPAEALVLSKGGEVIIPASGETPEDISTAAVVMDFGVALGGDLNILRTKSDGYFLASYISGKARLRLASMAQGNSVVHLYGAHIASLEMCLPPLPEQQKIASFLSSVDKKIDLLRQKKDSLELYKKGLIQKIFSQEIRFKQDDGSDFPDWILVKMSKLMSERNDQAPQSVDYPLMAFMAYKGVAPKGDRYDRSFLVKDEKGKKYKKTELGDFIYSSNNLETGSIGMNSFGRASISPVYSIFRIHSDHDFTFMSVLLSRPEFIYKMVQYRQGVVYGQWRIHERDFLNIEQEIPSLSEQKKIAFFLSAIDSKIQKTSAQVEQMETFKKGLLQQMFV